MNTVKFKIWETKIVTHTFAANRKHKRYDLISTNNGEPIATVNVYIDGLADDEIAIKDYSENQGMLSAMVRAVIVEVPHRYIPSGYIELPICRLTIKGKTL